MDGPPPAKKARLSMACNECRRRKVRCDADYPQCRNCAHRNTDCFTSDPRQPDVPVTRTWVEDKPQAPAENSALTTGHKTQPSPNIQREDAAESDHAGAPKPVQEVSPVYHPYDMSFQSEHRTNRFKMMGGSSSQCLMKSLDLYLDMAGIKPVTTNFQHGMRHAEEMVIPLALTLPAFPASEMRVAYVETYFARIHVLWPFLDIDETKNAIKYYATLTELNSVARDHIPILASAYLIMSLGADETAGTWTAEGAKYLQAAAELLGHIVVVPYLPAVQALLLFTIAYRGRNKDGLGWQTMGLAVRIAHTLGLHRHSAIKPSDQHGVRQKKDQLFHARIWGVCCCLEKMLQLESGRPSAIYSVNRDQMMGQAQRAPGPDFLQWNVGLAEYQGEISQHIYGHKPGERTAREILLNAARLDTAFLAWAKEIPLEFAPTSALFCSREDLHYATFLSTQFHQSMIALHRAALIAPRAAFDIEVEKYCAAEPSKHRLKRGELICTESARTIIRLSLEIQENKVESRILGTGPVLLSCVVLSISLVKNPRGRMQATDLELLKAGVEFTSDQYLKSGQDRRVALGVTGILDKVRQFLRHRPGTAAKRLRDHSPAEAFSASVREVQIEGEKTGWAEAVSPQPPMAPPPPAHQSHAAMAPRPAPSHAHYAANGSGPGTGPGLDENGDPASGVLYRNASWTHISSDQIIRPGPEGDNLSDSYIAGPDSEQASRMPFDDYDAEELWNWMYFMDSEEGMQTLMQQSV